MKCSQELSQIKCDSDSFVNANIYDSFLQKGLEQPHFSHSLGYSALNKKIIQKYNSYQQLFLQLDLNNILSFTKDILLKNQNFKKVVRQATINTTFRLLSNMTMVFTLRQDSLVVPQNFYSLKKNIYAANITFIEFPNNKYQICQKIDLWRKQFQVDHLHAETLANIYAIKFFLGTLPKERYS